MEMDKEFPESSGIVKLTPNVLSIRNNMPFTTHNELQHKNPFFLVFYANWCGHCKTLSPMMEALAKKYVSMSKPKPVAAIDCAQHNLDSSFQNIVEGYPTIFSVKGNSCKRYNGERSLEALENHLNERRVEESSRTSSTSSNSSKGKKVKKSRKSSPYKGKGGKNIFSKIRSYRRR